VALIPSVTYCLISGIVLPFCIWYLFDATLGPCIDVASVNMAVLFLCLLVCCLVTYLFLGFWFVVMLSTVFFVPCWSL
jgi:hypothetical protein